MSTVSNLSFEKTYRISNIILRTAGCHPDQERTLRWKIQYLITHSFNGLCFFVLTNSCFNHDIPTRKFDAACKQFVMVIVTITITYKYHLLLYYKDSVLATIKAMDEDYRAAEGYCEEEQKLIVDYAQRGVKTCKLWLIAAFAASFLFPLKAFYLMAVSYFKGNFEMISMFPMTWPGKMEENKEQPGVFLTEFTIHFIFTVYSAAIYVGFDPVIPIFILHNCSWLDILSRRLIAMFEKTDTVQLKKELRVIILKLQDIYAFVDTINNNYTFLYEYYMKSTTFLIPLTTFQVVYSLSKGEINSEFFLFSISCFLHFYMPCYYSDLLMETSERFRLTIYSCGWENHADISVRKMILFMLVRATKPLVISTVFYPICLDTFAEMCRQSYAIFNLMTAAFI